jgi:hypothetical protein
VLSSGDYHGTEIAAMRSTNQQKMQFQREYEAIRSMYFKKLGQCSEMLTIEPSLIKLWRLACMPDFLDIIDVTETLKLETFPMQTCSSENFFYLLAVM